LLVKLNDLGIIIWQKTIGGSGFDNLTKIISTSDQNILLCGYSHSNVSGDKNENPSGLNDF